MRGKELHPREGLVDVREDKDRSYDYLGVSVTVSLGYKGITSDKC